MLRRREDKERPIQLLFPIAKHHDWLERGSRSGQKGIHTILEFLGVGGQGQLKGQWESFFRRIKN
jgi:hypothetical protein